MERILVPCRKLTVESYKQGSSQVERTQKGEVIIFFTLPDPVGDETEEEYVVTKPRKVQYKNKWKISQGAICWVNLGKAQDEGLQFRQTRSSADCIEKVISTREDKIWYQRIRTPHPKTVLKNAWQVPTKKCSNSQAPINRVLKETSVCKEYHRMQYLKIKDE